MLTRPPGPETCFSASLSEPLCSERAAGTERGPRASGWARIPPGPLRPGRAPSPGPPLEESHPSPSRRGCGSYLCGGRGSAGARRGLDSGGGRREAGGGRWASPIPGRDLPARELPATALCREAGPLKIRGFPGTRVLTFPVRLHREAEMERTSPSSRIKPGYTSAEKTKRLSFFWDVLFLDKLCSGCPQIQLGHCEALLGSQLG